MDLDLGPLAPEADDPVARNGVAAFRELEGDSGCEALDRDGGALRRRLDALLAGRARDQGFHHRDVADPLERDRLHQGRVVVEMEPFQGFGDRFPAERLGQALDDLVEDLAAELDRLLALLRFHEPADLGPRLAGDDEAEPARLRMLGLGDEDFDLVAIFERSAQGHHPPVDLGADGLVAEVGVDGISEVDRGRALGKLDQLALRSEGEDPVLVHRHPGMLEQLLRGARMLEYLEQIVDPRVLGPGVVLLAFLIGPVGGEAVLGGGVHLLGSDLDLDPHPLVVDDGGVERFVAVALRRRDEVLEASRHYRPALVDEAQGPVAILDGADDRPEGHHVGQLLEADVPLRHLAPDREGMLLAPLHLRLDSVRLEMGPQAAADSGDEVALALVELLEAAGDGGIGVRLDLAEGESLHLLHELVHPDPLGERGVDVHRLAGDPLSLLFAGDEMEGAHVVKPVRELDEQHAYVARHGEQELPEIFRRPLALALRLDLAELGDPVDQSGDVGPEQFLDLLRSRDRILDRVVEDRGDDRLVVEAEVGEDSGHFDRVAVIRIARRPFLGAVRFHREDIGAVDHRLVGVRVVGPYFLEKFILSKHRTNIGWRGAALQHYSVLSGRGRCTFRARPSRAVGRRR